MRVRESIQHRYHRLVNSESGRGLIVAMDHCGGGLFPGLEDFEATLRRVIEARPDAVMLNVAMLRHFGRLFRGREAPAVIAAIDLNMMADKLPGELMEEGQNLEMASVEEALRYGADAVKILMTWGQVDLRLQHRAFERAGRTAEVCARWNMPLMIEPNLWGRRVNKEHWKDPGLLGDTARIAVEVGADLLKIDTPLNASELEPILRACMVPVFVLGGAKEGDVVGFLEKIDGAIRVGAAGAVIGRSVWQARDPGRMLEALRHVIYHHELDAAIKLASEAY